MTTWVVVMEMARPTGVPAVDTEQVSRLVTAVAELRPSALVAKDRYALQLHVPAEDPAAAIAAALALLADPARRLEVPVWPLVRVEVLTPAEFERECDQRRLGAAVPEPDDNDGERLVVLAFQDPLTGVASQALFESALEHAIRIGPVTGCTHAVLLVDAAPCTDRRLGRSAEQDLLTAIAARLREALRETDLVARIGATRLAALLRNTTPRRAASATERVSQRMRREIGALSPAPPTGPTVGLALYRPGLSGHDLLREATAATGWPRFNSSPVVPGSAPVVPPTRTSQRDLPPARQRRCTRRRSP